MAGGAQISSAGNAGRSDCRDRGAFWILRRWLHRSTSCREEPPHLVGHASSGHAFRGFGGVYIIFRSHVSLSAVWSRHGSRSRSDYTTRRDVVQLTSAGREVRSPEQGTTYVCREGV